jgi:hypothetical protein
MKKFWSKYYIRIIGGLIGSVGGYLYYAFIGCNSGTCPITSNPYISILYGTLIGYLIADMFKPKKKEENV